MDTDNRAMKASGRGQGQARRGQWWKGGTYVILPTIKILKITIKNK